MVQFRFRCISSWVVPQSEPGYHIQIKDSARSNDDVYRWTADHGTFNYIFQTKSEARNWANELSQQGNLLVYIRDSNPSDNSCDGYLVGEEGTGPRI